ncbi:MAG: family 10 glycosylhydrolase [Bacteroidia bacterium]|nr:family 10 glycosylhydrolase [Bacteroidia bacterium]
MPERSARLKSLACWLLCTLLPYVLPAQDAPKREFRGIWIATVNQIDWPSGSRLSTEEQIAQLTALLDSIAAHGFNTVIFQVRPAGDAFYDSPYEPWSQWLTGVQGQAPDPYYDPLAFLVSECHRRGMELHAWFNPFRAATDVRRIAGFAPEHVVNQHPEWLLTYGNSVYFDPGLPAARAWVLRVILDVVRRYDIDAVHFDDYFYPYKVDNQEFPDTLSYTLHGAGSQDLDAWRRSNVDAFVRAVHDSILAAKPWVRFGISPFAVWRNRSMDPEGSDTRAGIASYDDLHADIRAWVRKGWIDYVLPQLYFSIGFPAADYEKLLAWWARNRGDRHLYIGHSPYKINANSDKNWENPRQILEQVYLARDGQTAQGSAFFSANWLAKNPLGWADTLKNHLYRHPALIPPSPWIDARPPLEPYDVQLNSIRGGLLLRWKDPAFRGDSACYYVVYRREGRQVPEAVAEHIVAVLRDQPEAWLDTRTRVFRKYTYAITAVDRLHNESGLSEAVSRRRWSRR